MSVHKYDGNGFKKFLEEEGMSERVHAIALKQILAEDLRRAMKRRQMTLSLLSKRMRTSRTVVYDLLNPKAGATIDTLARACYALDVSLDLKIRDTPRGARKRAKRSTKVARRAPLAAREARSAS
jgi:transcriptional regulator with XRE-family HTH domain